ncbi:thiamine pyrophosphate-binding protein [Pseudonocardia acidicola]|uniref:Thiamine pyrophosphate-binding protein n=1 Tax=Pseudonocardia acidicola TaxID=2724939 RepID=A0ABX1S491_9PSEU|nr:thiamine pyrophosphate-dependent enzyme [Pseudonocardia acidicola]NMH96411.1 thiamine pyrophosphate-binding protein [Pseudonocardia acidicola]
MSPGSHTSVSPAVGLADGLHAAGVRRLFGMPGGGPNLEMIGAAAERGIGFTLAHGETAACVMAGAYGLLTGTAGTALVTRGPGLTSATNGLAQATLDRSPLLLVSDCVPGGQRARIAHQRLDQLAVAAPVTLWNGTLGHHDPAATVAAAAALAAGPPSGAVHLDYDPGVPGDVPPPPAPPAAPDRAALQAATTLAAGRRRPVVVLGVEAVAHSAALRRVLAGSGIPVLTTYQATGVLDAQAPESAGLFTNAALERPLLERADLIVGVGLDPVEPVPAGWVYDAPTVLLTATEVDPAYFGSATVVDGPPAETLAAVLGACAPGWPGDAGQRHRRARLADLAAGSRDGAGLHPIDLVRAVHDSTGDVQLTVDAGAHMLATMPFWPVTRPHGILISNGLATMGYALPAAIGAALARPGEQVVCLVGDGGLGMTLMELETLARLALPVTVVVFDDTALSLIELKQRAGQGDAGAVRFTPVDFAAVAAAMGVPAAVADDAGGVRAALARAGDGPFLLDARIDPAGYRHIIEVSRG